MNKQLNIVSFDVPYPPNYGGVIDVYYKIKALHQLGVKVHLHTFEYGRGKHKELNKICASIHYYDRPISPFLLLSKTPFIVKSRNNAALIKNLNSNGFPVILEGLHTSFNINKIIAKTYIRTHNIEHSFYKGLAKSEKNLFKKIFFFSESYKLKTYEKVLKKANGIFTISPAEQEYFQMNYGDKSVYIPAFHRSDFKQHTTQQGKFVLWHGDLRVSDNIRVAIELINVFKNTNYTLVIASSFEAPSVIANIKSSKNAVFENITEKGKLDDLLEKAHVNVLLTHQKTGIKLKLLYSLYQGKFIIANDKMIEDTGLESLCEKANTAKEILAKTSQLFMQNFTQKNLEERALILTPLSPIRSAKKIIDIIFS